MGDADDVWTIAWNVGRTDWDVNFQVREPIGMRNPFRESSGVVRVRWWREDTGKQSWRINNASHKKKKTVSIVKRSESRVPRVLFLREILNFFFIIFIFFYVFYDTHFYIHMHIPTHVIFVCTPSFRIESLRTGARARAPEVPVRV